MKVMKAHKSDPANAILPKAINTLFGGWMCLDKVFVFLEAQMMHPEQHRKVMSRNDDKLQAGAVIIAETGNQPVYPKLRINHEGLAPS